MRRRRGCVGGSIVLGWSASTAGPDAGGERLAESAGKLQLRPRIRLGQDAVPCGARAAPGRSWAAGRARPFAAPGRAPRCRPSRAGTIGAPVRSAMSAAPGRNGPSRPAGPLMVPSGICTKTAPASTTARAERTWPSIPSPPRHTGSSPPRRWISASRQRDVNVEGPLPRNQHRGSAGRACMATNGSIQPRCAPAIRR